MARVAASVDFRVSAAIEVPDQGAKRIEGESEEIRRPPKAFPVGGVGGDVAFRTEVVDGGVNAKLK